MEITASSFKIRANPPEGRKAISYQLKTTSTMPSARSPAASARPSRSSWRPGSSPSFCSWMNTPRRSIRGAAIRSSPPSDEVIVRDKLTTFTVTHSSVSDRIRAVITDDAPAYDPLAGGKVDTSIPLEDRAIGGLGVHLVKKLMNVSLYERIDGKKILTIDRPV